MKVFILATFGFFLLSCSGTSKTPTDKEVEQLVQSWYETQNEKDGGGNWEIQEIDVVSIEKDKNRKNIYHTVSNVKGIYHPPPLENPRPDEPYSDILRVELEWDGSKWVRTQ